MSQVWTKVDPGNVEFNRIFQLGSACTDLNSGTWIDSFEVVRRKQSGTVALNSWDEKPGNIQTIDSGVIFQGMLHIVVAIDTDGFVTLHVNGRSFPSEAHLISMPFKSSLNFLGVDMCSNNGLVGSIDEFRIWEGALLVKYKLLCYV